MTLILIALFLLLNLFDLIITDYNLRHGAVELNSDWQGMDKVTLPMVVDKAKWTLVVLIVYFICKAFYSGAEWILVLANGYYIKVAYGNIRTYFDIRG